MEKILVIGIAGGTGSGKTTLMKNLIARFGDVVTVLSHDNYYKRHDELTYEQRCQLNYDEPAALETDLMARHLDKLRQGEAIECPVYDFTVHNRSNDTVTILPRRVIVVEGILIFQIRAAAPFVYDDANGIFTFHSKGSNVKFGAKTTSLSEAYVVAVDIQNGTGGDAFKRDVYLAPFVLKSKGSLVDTAGVIIGNVGRIARVRVVSVGIVGIAVTV